MKSFLSRVLEGLGIAGSVAWLTVATTFISDLWEEASVTDGWSLQLPYVPIGFIMLAAWIAGFVVLIIKTKPKDRDKDK